MLITVNAKYTEGEAKLVVGQYENKRIALKLVDPETEEPLAVPTVNIPEYELKPGYVLLKGWSENEGMPQAMEAAGIVKLTGEKVPTGFVEAEVAELLLKPFRVTVQRNELRVADFAVLALDRETAEAAVWDQVQDFDFGSVPVEEADEAVVAITEVI